MKRAYITKSKAGHYTVTIHDNNWPVITKRHISTIEQARQTAAELLKGEPA